PRPRRLVVPKIDCRGESRDHPRPGNDSGRDLHPPVECGGYGRRPWMAFMGGLGNREPSGVALSAVLDEVRQGSHPNGNLAVAGTEENPHREVTGEESQGSRDSGRSMRGSTGASHDGED